MHTPGRLLVTIAVAVLVTAGCAQRAKQDARHAEQIAAARAVAAEAFPVSLDVLKKRPGVLVTDLDRGAGLQAVPQRAFVRVTGPAAVDDLTLIATLERLRQRDWILVSGSDTASACTPGPQALSCHFQDGKDDAEIVIVPLTAGGYELTASPATGPPPK